MARRSHGGFQRRDGRVARRETEWIANPFATDFVTLAANSFVIVNSLSAAGAAILPFTITRIRGLLVVQSDQDAADREPFGAIGGIVVSEKAVTTGPTAVPDPVTQVESDGWFMYQPWAAPIGAATAVGFGQKDRQYVIDSKAMRKVSLEEDIAFVLANAASAGTVEFMFQFRMLITLH